MQFLSTLSVLALATTAIASEHNFHARLHRRHDGYGYNESTSAVPSSSVAPVDPSSSVVSLPDFTTLPPVPTVTGVSSEVAQESSLNPGEEVVTETVDSTLTYTLGYGSSATVITTTIQHTTTHTVTRTVVMTRPVPAETGVAGEGPTGAAEPEPTTTVRQTSTITKVVTVYPVPSPSAGSEGDQAVTDVAANPTGAAGGVCGPPTTVYVTEQETVYVTQAPSSDAAVETEAVIPVPIPSSQHVEHPIQSSSGGFYPTGASPSAPGHAGPSGFTTTYQPVPSGHVMPAYGAYRF